MPVSVQSAAEGTTLDRPRMCWMDIVSQVDGVTAFAGKVLISSAMDLSDDDCPFRANLNP